MGPVLFFLLVSIGVSMSGLFVDKSPRQSKGWRVIDTWYVDRKLKQLQSQCSDIVALKVLKWDDQCKVWRSPLHGNPWHKGVLMADQMPDFRNDHGIYTGKNFEAIDEYLCDDDDKNYLFAVGLFEPVDEYEKGYRSAGAYIIEKIV